MRNFYKTIFAGIFAIVGLSASAQDNTIATAYTINPGENTLENPTKNAYFQLIPEENSLVTMQGFYANELTEGNNKVNYYTTTENGRQTYFLAEAGKRYILQFYTSSGSPLEKFTCTLDAAAYNTGEDPANPIVVKDGVPAFMPTIVGGTFWNKVYTNIYFCYTAEVDGALTVNTSAETLAWAKGPYSADTSWTELSNPSNAQIDITKDTEYIFKITKNTATMVTLTAKEEIKPGSTSGAAIEIEGNTQTLPAETADIWYKYTAPEDGILTISCDLDAAYAKYNKITAYLNEVDDSNSQEMQSLYNSANYSYTFKPLSINVVKGDVVYVMVHKNTLEENATLTFGYRDIVPGENPEVAIRIELTDNTGSVSVPQISYTGDPMYYVVSLPADMVTSILGESGKNMTFRVYDNIDCSTDSQIASSGSVEVDGYYQYGVAKISPSVAQDYYIKVNTNSEAQTLTVTVREPQEGEAANMPIVINVTENPMLYSFDKLGYDEVRWYALDLKVGELTITSKGQTMDFGYGAYSFSYTGALYSADDLSTPVATSVTDYADYTSDLNASITTPGKYLFCLESLSGTANLQLSGDALVVDTESGVSGVNAESADAVYYDLSGRRISTPAVHGIYIRKANGKAEKVVVR